MNVSELRSDVNSMISSYGAPIRIRKYIIGYDATYGTTSGISLSGTSWCMGLQQPIRSDMAGDDYKFLEQGKIKTNDSKVYLTGSVNLSGNKVKVGVGSPNPTEYELLNQGAIPQYLNGSVVYQKAYIRILNTGSWLGEV